MLRPLTLVRGLSLGDRYFLALAKREGAVALPQTGVGRRSPRQPASPSN